MQQGYAYMIRLGPHDVLCLKSPVDVAKRAVRVQDVIEAATRRVRRR